MRCDWFRFKGHDCREYGIRVSDRPPIAFPQERVTFTNVPGRSGTLAITEGENVYDDMILSFNCVMKDSSRAADIAAWLHGEGELYVPYRDNGFYKARYTGQLKLTQVVRGRENVSFSVEFRCKPLFYFNTGKYPININSASASVQFQGSAYAEPVYQFVTNAANATVTITCGENAITITGIETSGTTVYVDCENKMVYTLSTNLCSSASGSFPVIAKPTVGTTVSIGKSGNCGTVTMYPNWRSI